MSEIKFLGDMERLEVKPGDRFVLKYDGHLSSEAAYRLRDMWEEFIGDSGAKLLILEKGMSLGVVGAEDVEAGRAA